MASYKLPLGSLSFGVQEFSYILDAEFFNAIEQSDVVDARVEATLVVDRKRDDIYQLDFAMKGVIVVPCDRCLDPMELPIDTSYSLSVKGGDELDDSKDGVLVIPANWRDLDLAPIMRDTVLLCIPIMHTHPEGKCNPDMMSHLGGHLADEGFDEHADGTDGDDTFILGDDPRWAALKKLSENNE